MKNILVASAFIALGASLATAPASAAKMMARPTCATGDKVVWVVPSSHTYYAAGSAMYGKGTGGKYACASKASAMGMHVAKTGAMSGGMSGSMHGGSSGMMNGSTSPQTMMSPNAMMSPHAMMSSSSMASPGPSPTGIRVTPGPIVTASPSN